MQDRMLNVTNWLQLMQLEAIWPDGFLHSQMNQSFKAWHVLISQIGLWGGQQLHSFGNESINSLLEHFDDILQRQGVDADSVPLEWIQLKIHVHKLVAADPEVSYLDLWERVLKQNEERFRNVLVLLTLVLLVPIHTSELERGFSMMNRIKHDWRANLSTPNLNALMRVCLLGPPPGEYEPMKSIRLWWQAGRRPRRPYTQPYGPRERHNKAADDDNMQGQDDDSLESDEDD